MFSDALLVSLLFVCMSALAYLEQLQLPISQESRYIHIPVIDIDVRNVSNRSISKSLFGLNLEFTRHDIFNGLSAQIVANKFFAIPSPSPGSNRMPAGMLAPHWHVSNGMPYVIHPGISGGKSSTVRCNTSCGFEQKPQGGGFSSSNRAGFSIYLEAGREYEFAVAYRSSNAVIFGKAEVDAVFMSRFGTKEMQESWKIHKMRFVASRTILNGTLKLSFEFHDAEADARIDIGYVSMLPADHFYGMRSDVISRLAEIGFKGPLRYPGGCYSAVQSDWRTQMVEPERRRITETPPKFCEAVEGGIAAYTDGFLMNGPNTDEYMQLCFRLGMEPAIAIRLEFGTDEEVEVAKSWVHYCNVQRLYNVTKWYLGNEIAQHERYIDWPRIANKTKPAGPYEYVEMLDKVIPAMLQEDKKLELFAVGMNNVSWDAPYVRSFGRRLTASSLHYYDKGNSPDLVKKPHQELLPQLRRFRRLLDDHTESSHTVKISLDEYGLGYPWLEESFGTTHALYTASVLIIAMRYSDELQIISTNYFEPINEGMISVGQFDSTLTPVGMAAQYLARHQGRLRINTDVEIEDVDYIASTLDESLLMTLINKNTLDTKTVELHVCEFSLVNLQVQSLVATGTTNRDTFIAVDETVSVDYWCNLVVRLPPFSIVQVGTVAATESGSTLQL